ncbi:CoA-binding protein [Enterococcus saccharolyticus]|uniref:CoA-binding protein n=1 Tax=Enterococcus saccharolyticus subsp. saccharolyticus ATCC 43076 TaxID=1139996 RepID=S0NXF4_9ENTE|nr:CoA-binding protein [Enterococcus saccharolyticus]EOT29676.1 CoA-binding protein [Enterococcus saccharolyticus subsp. saccharolyticus ATCC 43076]EOT80836.1 CoA-binding protein [Enterococcus saccharolyticus subsp. saccharolyticus ATCC 43076]OJG89704.1 CoA-binding protein [Enterococcus saccharolyticus]
MSFQNPSEETIQAYLKEAKNIAVIGLSNKEDRTSYQIAQLLQEHGYRIFPVNPVLAGQTILGEPVYEQLQDITETIDIVDIFRRSEFLPDIAKAFLETNAKVYWAQLGIENDEAAEILQAAGRTDIVMNRCIKIELAKMA